MPVNVKPAVTEALGPEVYARWRATTLGTVTEALEQRCILTLVGSVDGQRVLDLGCGDGLLVATLASQRAQAVGIDVDHAALQAAISRPVVPGLHDAHFVEGRIERLPFPDGTFDVVTAVTVLCLVADRSTALQEAARVLRPGGRLIIGDLDGGVRGRRDAASKAGWGRGCGVRRTSGRPATFPGSSNRPASASRRFAVLCTTRRSESWRTPSRRSIGGSGQ
jgi:SAM-dependent methyltransferase